MVYVNTTPRVIRLSLAALVMPRLLEVARRQKVRSNSGLSQRDLLNSGIDIMETDGELYSEQKQQASRRSADAQLFAAGLLLPPPPPPLPAPHGCAQACHPSPAWCLSLKVALSLLSLVCGMSIFDMFGGLGFKRLAPR